MNRLEQLYFKYLVNTVCSPEEQAEYEMLLMDLYTKEFVSYDEFDDNLVVNSVGLRDRFLDFSATGRKLYDPKTCFLDYNPSVLEIMVYISIELEDTIMSNSRFGDRTGLWFWSMIDSLGLKNYDNLSYDEEEINQKLDNFIERRYQKDGKGGLFTVKSHKYDARHTNIWTQAMEFVTEFATENGEIL